MDGELGGAVDGQTGSGLPEHPQDAQVLDEDGVHPDLGGLGGRPGGGGELPVGDQGVEGEVDLGPPDMAVRNRRGQFLQREVLGIAAGVEIPAAQVDGVGAPCMAAVTAAGRGRVTSPMPSLMSFLSGLAWA